VKNITKIVIAFLQGRVPY